VRNLSFYFLLSILPFIAVSQKGFQFGVGFNHNIVQTETIKYLNDNELKVSNIYGLSVNLDYTLSSKCRIKSGFEYKSQSLDFGRFLNTNAEYIMIPIVFNYNFSHLERSGLTLGIDAGFSFDKPIFKSFNTSTTSRESETTKETVTRINMNTQSLPTGVFEFYDYISLRYGFSAKYNMGKSGQLNFYAQIIDWGIDGGFLFETNEIITVDGQVTSSQTTKNYFNMATAGLQFGLYYTFGTLTFK